MTDTALAPNTPPPDPTTADEKPARLGWALAVICVAQLMVVLDATVVNDGAAEHPRGASTSAPRA